MMADNLDNRSLGDLLAELSRETGQLVRKEFELATTELTAQAKKAARAENNRPARACAPRTSRPN